MSPAHKKNIRGQTLIGVIIALSIFLIFSQATVSLIISAYELVTFTRSRITAQHLATEQIETIRNLSYSDVGNVDGIPNGIIPQSENVYQNGQNYKIDTTITYIDDEFDGVNTADPNPNDYKKVSVLVTWGTIDTGRKVGLTTYISAETTDESGGGTLKINVFDSYGQPVADATVAVVADSINPIVNATYQTNNDGEVILPGATACNNCYRITVTKDGYNSDRTYGTSEVVNPNKPHATVVESGLTEVGFSIDHTATLSITTVRDKDNNFSLFPNQTFRLHGSKTIGTDSLGSDVYKFDTDIITDGSGVATIETIEWDSYSLSMPTGSSWDIFATYPLQPIIVLPTASVEVTLSTTAATNHRLLSIFKDIDSLPIASLSATLTDGASFEETYDHSASESADTGQAFFANLSEQLYYLEASAPGYVPYSDSVFVSEYTTETVVMQPETP